MSELSLNQSEKISIIVPMYNGADKIERCIKSLVNQSYKNIEIIIINDGSTDNSADICQEYVKQDNRIVFINKQNGGVSSARNEGIKKAAGKYVMFVDADDYIAPDACETMVKEIIKTDTDMVIASFYSVSKGSVVKEHICKYRVCRSVKDIDDNFEYIYRECFFNSPWNKLYKRKYITKYFKEDMRYFEDYYFNLDYMDNISSFVMIEKAFYYYVEDTSNSLTKVFRKELFDVFPVIYLRQAEFFYRYFGEKYHNLLKESFIYGLYNSIQKLVYSAESGKFKLATIIKWMNNEVFLKSIDKTFINYINQNCTIQYRFGYKAILNKSYKKIYYFFKLKYLLQRIIVALKK